MLERERARERDRERERERERSTRKERNFALCEKKFLKIPFQVVPQCDQNRENFATLAKI